MTNWNPQANELFLKALELGSARERQEYLDGACGGDAALRGEVEALLEASSRAGDFLESSAPQPVLTAMEQSVGEQPGAVIGPYKLLEQIGEGGFGVVFMAEQQQPIRRKVALKILKPGMDTRQIITRFEAERQALALMDHPNIAHVHDGGATPSGRPFFVMELVRGVPITDYCDHVRMAPSGRLDLFLSVCQAIQHAHQKGIIHRDIKPSNVLVTERDGKPLVKVIDFGIAKATGTQLTEKTLFTNFAQMIGTPLYMSPEQAGMNTADVDTRSDIYSLGVLLYELLTGQTPFDKERLKKSAFDEIRRIIREEEPPKPSARLSESNDSLPSISAQRRTEPTKLTKLVRGELDWIVMKALEKDRGRRYETANGLAMDVQRYLADEAVQASPPSTAYRFKKFLRRNRKPVWAVTLVVLALLAGVIGTGIGLVRAEQRAEGEREAKEEAHKRLEQIEKGTEILASVFRDVDPRAETKEGVTLRVLLGRRLVEAARQLEGEAVGDPLVVARLQHLMGVSLRELGHPDHAEAVFGKALATRERLLTANHLDTVATKHNLAGVYRDRGKHPQAEKIYVEVVAARTAQLGADHPDTLSSKNNFALLLMDLKDLGRAEPLLQEVLKIRLATLKPDDPKLLQSKNNLAGVYDLQGKYDLAEPLLQEVLAARISQLGHRHLDTMQSKNNLGLLYDRQGKYDESEALLHEALEACTAELGPRHAFTLNLKQNLGVAYSKREKFDAAAALTQEVLQIRSTTLPADHPWVLTGKSSLATLHRRMKKYDRSIALFEELLKLERTKFRSDHPDTLETQAKLGVVYREAGRVSDALAQLEEVYEKGRQYRELRWVGNALLTAYVQAGRKPEAADLLKTRVEAARKEFPADSLKLAGALTDIGQALLDGKAHADAEPFLRESLSIRDKHAAAAWETDRARSVLGEALSGQKKYADAEPLLLSGYDGLKKQEAKLMHLGPSNLTNAMERLALLYEGWGKPDEATKWRKELQTVKLKVSGVRDQESGKQPK